MLSEQPGGRMRMSALAELIVQSRSRVTHTANRLGTARLGLPRARARGRPRGHPRPHRPGLGRDRSRWRRSTSRACGATCSTSSRPRAVRLPRRGDAARARQHRGGAAGTGRSADEAAAGRPHRPCPAGWETMARMTAYPADAPASDALLARARAVTPGGVNSPVRAFRAVGGTPRFMASGVRGLAHRRRRPPLRRPHLQLGADDPRARPPDVLAAVDRGDRQGLLLRDAERERGRPRRGDRRPGRPRRAGPPRVNSGTEATMSAIRLARGFTGRSLIVKFAGCYHGHVDSLLAVGGLRGRHPRACPTPPASRRRWRPRRSSCPTTTSTRSRRRSSSGAARSLPSSPRRPRATWGSSRRRRASPRGCAGSPPSTARCSSPTR